MIPYSYDMVDMGGIDLAEANHTVVPGIYEKIVEAMNPCGDLILYNWKFAGINITPSAYTVLQQASSILINGLIQVTERDEVTVLGIEPPPPPIVPVEPLVASANGIYQAVPPKSGFNPVTVSVNYVGEELTAEYNGVYLPTQGVEGFTKVIVNVESGANPFQGYCLENDSGYYLTGWYQNRRVTLISNDRFVTVNYNASGSYYAGAFLTLVDHGVATNVCSGDYPTATTLSILFDDNITRNVYVYGGMNGSGSNGQAILYDQNSDPIGGAVPVNSSLSIVGQPAFNDILRSQLLEAVLWTAQV